MGGALLWLQSSKAHTRFNTGETFAEVVCSRFGRDELQQLIRHFNRLCRTNSMAEYAEKLNRLMHILLAHHASWNSMFFVTQFVDGLHCDIQYVGALRRPKDLDTVVALAGLQGEVLEAMRKEPHRGETPSGVRPVLRIAGSLPLPPGRTMSIAKANDRRGTEGARSIPSDDKLAGRPS